MGAGALAAGGESAVGGASGLGVPFFSFAVPEPFLVAGGAVFL